MVTARSATYSGQRRNTLAALLHFPRQKDTTSYASPLNPYLTYRTLLPETTVRKPLSTVRLPIILAYFHQKRREESRKNLLRGGECWYRLWENPKFVAQLPPLFISRYMYMHIHCGVSRHSGYLYSYIHIILLGLLAAILVGKNLEEIWR